MFTVERRDQVRDELLARARTDERIVGAARTGSAARGTEDRWSDIDLFLGVRADIDVVTPGTRGSRSSGAGPGWPSSGSARCAITS